MEGNFCAGFGSCVHDRKADTTGTDLKLCKLGKHPTLASHLRAPRSE